MKITDTVKKRHWFRSSTLAIVMLAIFTVLFVIAFSRVLNQKEVVVEDVVPTKSDESNKSVVATEIKEIEEVEPYKGEESYAKVRNSLLADGWVLLERSDFAESKSDKEPKSENGKKVLCKKMTITPYTTIAGEKRRELKTKFCWKEQLVSKKITNNLNELLSDSYWDEEDGGEVAFVHPSNKEFENKVRFLTFYICNRSYYQCSGKPKGYLKMSSNKIITRDESESYYLDSVVRGFDPYPIDAD